MFNLFVFLQLFNFLNARKIEDELDIFEKVTESSMFIGIVFLILFLQILIILIGNRPLNCSPHVPPATFLTFPQGMNFAQWLISVVLSSFGLLVSVILKLVAC